MFKKIMSKLWGSVKKFDERRSEPRFKISQHRFIIEFGDDQSDDVCFAAGRDISLHGIRFATKQGLKQGEVIDLSLRFPDDFEGGAILNVKAKIVHIFRPKGTSRNRVGCRLQYDDELTKKTLQNLIKWLQNHPT